MGRSRTTDLIFSVNLLTSPSPVFGFTSRMRPRGHKLLGEFSSTTSTRSPTSKLLVGLENVLNVSLEEEFCDHFLVPALGGTPRLPLGPYKISASI